MSIALDLSQDHQLPNFLSSLKPPPLLPAYSCQRCKKDQLHTSPPRRTMGSLPNPPRNRSSPARVFRADLARVRLLVVPRGLLRRGLCAGDPALPSLRHR